MTRMPLCHFFVEGHCTKDDCQFLHIRPEDNAVECPWYARGFCKHGPKCRKKHARKELCPSYMAGFCPKGPREHTRFHPPPSLDRSLRRLSPPAPPSPCPINSAFSC